MPHTHIIRVSTSVKDLLRTSVEATELLTGFQAFVCLLIHTFLAPTHILWVPGMQMTIETKLMTM